MKRKKYRGAQFVHSQYSNNMGMIDLLIEIIFFIKSAVMREKSIKLSKAFLQI